MFSNSAQKKNTAEWCKDQNFKLSSKSAAEWGKGQIFKLSLKNGVEWYIDQIFKPSLKNDVQCHIITYYVIAFVLKDPNSKKKIKVPSILNNYFNRGMISQSPLLRVGQ